MRLAKVKTEVIPFTRFFFIAFGFKRVAAECWDMLPVSQPVPRVAIIDAMG